MYYFVHWVQSKILFEFWNQKYAKIKKIACWAIFYSYESFLNFLSSYSMTFFFCFFAFRNNFVDIKLIRENNSLNTSLKIETKNIDESNESRIISFWQHVKNLWNYYNCEIFDDFVHFDYFSYLFALFSNDFNDIQLIKTKIRCFWQNIHYQT